MKKLKNRIVVDGKNWFYSTVSTDYGEMKEAVYDGEGKCYGEFKSTDDMVSWIHEETLREQRKEKEKIQEAFMRRLEQLKGDSSDSDFAVYLGMNGATVYQYLTGRRFPTAAALIQIADRCNVTIDWLVGRV